MLKHQSSFRAGYFLGAPIRSDSRLLARTLRASSRCHPNMLSVQTKKALYIVFVLTRGVFENPSFASKVSIANDSIRSQGDLALAREKSTLSQSSFRSGSSARQASGCEFVPIIADSSFAFPDTKFWESLSKGIAMWSLPGAFCVK